MWGYGNGAGLIQLANYSEAQSKFKNTAPIRGRSSECRPLGRNRRYSHFEIQENMRVVEDGCLGKWQRTYSAQLYDPRNRIEWFPDGTVQLVSQCWSTPTTLSFFNYTVGHFGEIVSANGKWYFKCKNGKGYIFDKGVTLEPTGEVVNPRQEYKYKANRKAMNAVRKRYAKFIEYASNMYLIDSHVPENKYEWKDIKFTEQRYWKTESKINRAKLFTALDEFNQSGDLTLAFEMATLMGRSFGWSGATCTKAEFVKGFTDILKYQFAKEVFISEPVEIGTMFYDRNAKYF